jgi:hypothetical protein
MSETPTSDWSWINAAAQRFERAWKQGPRPRIEEFLVEVEESLWPPLLEDLLRVECELRRRAGEEPSREDERGAGRSPMVPRARMNPFGDFSALYDRGTPTPAPGLDRIRFPGRRRR